MMLLYDPEADVAQVEIGEVPDGAVHHTEDVSRGPYYTRGIDRGKNGEILGYNFMLASQGVDLKTGRLKFNPDMIPQAGKVIRGVCPNSPGAKDWNPSSFSKATGLIYVPHNNLCMDWQTKPVNYIAGTPYIGVTPRFYPGPGGDAELAQITRGGAGGMLMMLDLDHFKRINDGHGHAAGDAVLVHLAQLLREQLRRGDVAARLGGEEFAVLVPQTAPHDAVALAERLRVALEHSQIDIGSGFIQVTASLGLSPLEGDAVGVLARADVALYEAKRSGRNRVRMAGQEKMLAAI